MSFGEEKLISHITKFLGLKLTSYKSVCYTRLYKCYSFAVMVILLLLNIWCIDQKYKRRSKDKLEVILWLLCCGCALITILASIFLDVFRKNKKIESLRTTAEKYLQSLAVQEKYERKQRIFAIKLVIIHIVLVIIFIANICLTTYTNTWRYSKYHLFNTLSEYILAIEVMHTNNFTLFLVFTSKIINRRFTELLNPLLKSRNEEVGEIKAGAKIYIILCDLIKNLNKVIGFRILLVLVYSAIRILECVELLLHHWHQNMIANILKVTRMISSCTLLVSLLLC